MSNKEKKTDAPSSPNGMVSLPESVIAGLICVIGVVRPTEVSQRIIDELRPYITAGIRKCVRDTEALLADLTNNVQAEIRGS